MTRQFTPGYSEFDNPVANMDISTIEIDHADLDATSHTYTIPIPAGTYLAAVGAEILEAFAGGVPTLALGDGTTVNKFMATTDLSATTLDAFALLFKGGKKYKTAGTLVLTGTADLTAGKVKLHLVRYSLAGNWRIPAM